MESQSPQQTVPQPQVVQCQCNHGRRRGWGVIGSFFRFIGLLVLLTLVFVAGLAIGGFGFFGMPFEHVYSAEKGAGVGPGMMLRGSLRGFREQLDAKDRRFGVVTAIAGQKITIADNGGGTQTVTVNAQTSVYDGETEVAVWKLRVGNAIRVHGNDKDDVLTAQLIEIIR